MIEKWQLFRLNQEYKALCEQHADEEVRQRLSRDKSLTEAASLLVVCQLAFASDEENFEHSPEYAGYLQMTHNLATILDTTGVSPEDLQAAMQHDEPSLLHEID